LSSLVERLVPFSDLRSCFPQVVAAGPKFPLAVGHAMTIPTEAQCDTKHMGTCITSMNGFPVSFTDVYSASGARRSMDDFFSYGSSGAGMGAAMYVGSVES
jgi:hypothetical protein